MALTGNRDEQIEQPLDPHPDVTAGDSQLAAAILSADLQRLEEWAVTAGTHSGQIREPLDELMSRVLRAAESAARRLPEPDGSLQLASRLLAAAAQAYQAAVGPRDDALGTSNQDSLRDRVEELTAIHRVISSANSSLKLSDMLLETAQAVVAVTHADVCSVFLYEPERDELVLTASSDRGTGGVEQVRLRLGEGITGWAAMAGIPVAVRDAASDPRFKFLPGFHEERAASMLAVPVVLFTKEKLVGVITVRTYVARDFSENEIKFLETVAGEIAIAIENARLYEQTDSQLRQKVTELTTLQGVSAHIAATLNLSEVLSLIAHQAAHLVHADGATIYALNPEAGTLEEVAHYDLRDPHKSIYEGKIGPRVVLDIEKSVIARTVMRGIPTALPPDTDSDLDPSRKSHGYQSMFCVPLVAPRGIMGGICLYDRNVRQFSEEQVHLLDAFAHEAAIALENSRLYEAALQGLHVKSVMLQEMNHRVRNNLQTVAGLLSMQLRRMSPESKAAVAVRESISRIQSMAAVHDLMVGRDVEHTTVYDVSRRVAEAAVSTLSKPGFRLKLKIEEVEAERLNIDSHTATLLALVLNELITNAILHGFEGKTDGELRIRAWQSSGEAHVSHTTDAARPRVFIEVSDNGVGIPEGFDPVANANLGLNIVKTMVVADLHGEFKMTPGKRGGGTRALLTLDQSLFKVRYS